MMEDRLDLKPDSVRIFIVRHAEHITPALTHLSRKGSLQATAIANTLKRKRKVAAVYYSPRSLETARNIAKELGIGITQDPRLLPYDSGRLTGLSIKQVQEKMPEVYQKRFVERNPDYKVPDGESLNDRLRRVKSFLGDIIARHRGEQVVVVTHGGIIDDLFRNARSLPPSQLTGLKKPYGSLSVLVHDHDGFHEELWGAVSHLPQVVAESPTGGQLYLFPHQVAGSFPMLRGDLGELCKPATEAELRIYDRMHSEQVDIARFAPKYLGKVTIDVKHILENQASLDRPLELMHSPAQESVGEEDSTGDDKLMVDVENNNSKIEGGVGIDDGEDIVGGDDDSLGCRKRRRTASVFADRAMIIDRKRQKSPVGGSNSMVEEGDAMTDAVNSPPASSMNYKNGVGGVHGTGFTPHLNLPSSAMIDGHNHRQQQLPQHFVDRNGGGMTTTTHMSGVAADEGRQWSVNTLWDRFIEHRKKKAMEVGPGKYVYLVMENLTHGLTHPHILDLKMGTQQHGSHESAEKIASKQLRVAQTTSKTLGTRIGGMQIYDQKERTYVLKDKYWGRSLDEEGLYQALALFVTEQQTNKIRSYVCNDIIKQLDRLEDAVKASCWRFYGCSLLLVYDGSMGVHQRRERFSSGASDCSDLSMQSNPETTHGGFFGGYASSLFDNAFTSQHHHRGTSPLCPQPFGGAGSCSNGNGGITRGRSLSFDLAQSSHHRNSYCVQVRLIDFAKTECHTTNGPDQGLLFGIRNLRKLFSRISLEAPCTANVNLSSVSMSVMDD